MSPMHTPTDLRSLLAAASPVVDADYLATATVAVAHAANQLHLGTTYCPARCSSASAQTMTLPVIAARTDLCDQCWAGRGLADAMRRNHSYSGDRVIMILYSVVRATQTHRQAQGYIDYHKAHGRFRSPKAVTTHLARIEAVLSHRAHALPEGTQEANPVYTDLEIAQAKLTALTATDTLFTSAQVNEVHHAVHAALTPTWYKAPHPTVDQTQVLFGIAPPPHLLAAHKPARLAIQRLALRHDDTAIVMLVPRYIAEYLSTSRAWRSSAKLNHTLTQTVTLPPAMDTPTQELAAGLWSPDGLSALTDLNEAVASALTLVQTAPQE